MRLVLRHPVWSGLALEGALIVLFMLFPCGSCNWTAAGGLVVYAHYPALLFVEDVLGIGFSGTQALLSAGLMIPVWVGLLFALRWISGRAGLVGPVKPGTANNDDSPNGGLGASSANSQATERPPSVT